jgi:regulator of sigma E protease
MDTIFEYANLLAGNVWLYGGTFLLVLGVLVFVHEWGHYIVARIFGIRVETFSIGFGREIFGINDSSGTRWKFSLFPLGGYVKLFGDTDPASARHSEDVSEGDEPPRPMTQEEKEVAFFARPVWQRAAVVFAGPAINFVFAVAILSALYIFHGKPVTPPVAAAVIHESAAEEAGFQPNDVILSINGEKINRFENIRRAVMIALDTPMKFRVMRNGDEISLTAVPERMEMEDHFGFRHSRGMLGILGPLGPGNAFSLENIVSVDGKNYEDKEELRKAIISRLDSSILIGVDYGGGEIQKLIVHPLSEYNKGIESPDAPNFDALVIDAQLEDELIQYGFPGGIIEAAHETYIITASTLEALGQMITGVRSAEELGGIIRIGAMAGDMATAGFLALITFTALLSINLGLINLFPIPLLDGGHLLFYFLETVKGSPISENIQEYAFRLGLAILVGIMLFANLNDIVQLIR